MYKDAEEGKCIGLHHHGLIQMAQHFRENVLHALVFVKLVRALECLFEELDRDMCLVSYV